MSVNNQIFLCHASEDKERVRAFYERLKSEGFNPWLDEENLIPGQNWEDEIPRALKASKAVIIFLSNVSVHKRGFVQREFKLAYTALQEIPEGQIFVIPIKLDDCDVPNMFKSLQWTFIESDQEMNKVLESLRGQILPSEDVVKFELSINIPLNEFTEEIQQEIVKAMCESLSKGSIKVVGKRKGSTKLIIEVSPAEAECLKRAIDRGELSELGVVGGKICRTVTGGSVCSRWSICGYLAIFIAIVAVIPIILLSMNHPPVLSPSGDQSVDVNSQLIFPVAASDPDNDELYYSITGLKGAIISDANVIWTTENIPVGIYRATIEVTDGDKSDFESIEITVKDNGSLPITLTTKESYTAKFQVTPKNLMYSGGDCIQIELIDIDNNRVLGSSRTFDVSGMSSFEIELLISEDSNDVSKRIDEDSIELLFYVGKRKVGVTYYTRHILPKKDGEIEVIYSRLFTKRHYTVKYLGVTKVGKEDEDD